MEVSDDKTTVTICDFGITTAGSDEKAKTSKNVEKVVADDDAKFKEAIQDLGEHRDGNEEAKRKEKKRLNIVTLTKWSDLRKWHKVNYEGRLISGGMGKSLKGLGEKTEKLWSSTRQFFTKKEASEDLINDDDSLTDLMDEQMKIVEAVIRKDSKGSDKKTDQKMAVSVSEDSTTAAKENMLKEFLTSESIVDSIPEFEEPLASESEKTSNKLINEPNASAHTVAKNYETNEQLAHEIIINSPPQPLANKSVEEKQQSWHGSFMKSLSNMLPQNDRKKRLFSRPNFKSSDEDESKLSASLKKDTVPDLPRSDPPILVLARTRFLLERGEDFLPPYHIVNSNSECIAVWCKTGRWSTLQASVFLHSTAIGNTKSTTAISLAAAATQPWLLAAVIPAGMAAIGTPWIMLKVANDKWNAATMRLTEEFWSHAEPHVFVECIEKWGQLRSDS